MSFIIDIFENLLKYNDKEVFIVIDNDNVIWFKMRDVLRLLGYSTVKKTVYVFKINTEYKSKLKYIKGYPLRDTPLNAQPDSIFLNESGLYQLLSNSKKDIAKQFRLIYSTIN